MFKEMSDYRVTEETIEKEDGWFTTRTGIKRRWWTTEGSEIYVTWKGGSSNWIPFKDLKESFPVKTAMYTVLKGIDEEPAFAWGESHI
jgi:hypothetical protein